MKIIKYINYYFWLFVILGVYVFIIGGSWLISLARKFAESKIGITRRKP